MCRRRSRRPRGRGRAPLRPPAGGRGRGSPRALGRNLRAPTLRSSCRFPWLGLPPPRSGSRGSPRSYLIEVDAIPELGRGSLSVGAVRERVGFEPHRDVLREQILELVGGERLREEEPLAQIAFHGDELFQLVGAL